MPGSGREAGDGIVATELASQSPAAIATGAGVPSGRVAGEYGGISHTPREYSRPDACGNGIDVLANAVLTLAESVQTP
jgi:beta-ureidopropionase / N-carbamoyl-L-amino-acid hydrolase